MQDLSHIRRLEAVGFRSWPSTSTFFDGAWAIRLTAALPAKRLNSVNPLDPADHKDIELRLHRAAQRFKGFARPLIFRQTPLASVDLDNILDAKGWRRFDETLVMVCDLSKIDLDSVVDRVPVKNTGQWVEGNLLLNQRPPEQKGGLAELLTSIRTRVGLFSIDGEDHNPVASAVCVQDQDMAGLFEVVTSSALRRKGLGRDVVATALKWARNSGARQGWLQVTTANHAAIALYRSFGFREAYRYAYRQAPERFD
jgi:GNAT superfamily N-acetyltransferase